MKIDQIWRELEQEALRGGRSTGWLLRAATPDPRQMLSIGIDRATGAKGMLLSVSPALLPRQADWPECNGLELSSVSVGAMHYFAVRLRDATADDVFTVLAEDVASRIDSTGDATSALAALVNRLRRWQQFLSSTREGLGLEAQRGLWGELHVLQKLLGPVGVAAAVNGWRAPTASHQDFQFPAGAVEVKTTASKQPQSIRITSERQLDTTGVGNLFLHVVIVDERDVGPASGTAGRTLPQIVEELRVALASDAASLSLFNGRLLDAGYRDAHVARYQGRRWSIRRERSYRVLAGFPRMLESELPPGVGDISYSISLVACEPFAVADDVMIMGIGQPASGPC